MRHLANRLRRPISVRRRRRGGGTVELGVATIADSQFVSTKHALRAELYRGTASPTRAFILAYHESREAATAVLASGAFDEVIADLDLRNVRAVERAQVPRDAMDVTRGANTRRRTPRRIRDGDKG
jgi:hypothetical protein